MIRCGAGSNANVKRHLVNVHGTIELMPKSRSTSSTSSTIPFDAYRKAKLDEAAIKCIVLDSRPFGDFRKIGMYRNSLFPPIVHIQSCLTSLVIIKYFYIRLCSFKMNSVLSSETNY